MDHYTKDDKPIISNSVIYIATLVGGRRGIQSRFGIDQSLDGPTADPTEARAGDARLEGNARQAERIVCSALESRAEHAGSHFHSPYLAIHPGQLESIADQSALRQHWLRSKPRVTEARAVQVGATAASVAFRTESPGERLAGVFLVRLEGDGWEIKSGSSVVA